MPISEERRDSVSDLTDIRRIIKYIMSNFRPINVTDIMKDYLGKNANYEN